MSCLTDIDEALQTFWQTAVQLIEAAHIDSDIEDELLNGNTDALFAARGCPVPSNWTIVVDDCYERLVIAPNSDGDGVIVLIPYSPRGLSGDIEPEAATRSSMNSAASAVDTANVYLDDSDVVQRISEGGAAGCSYGCEHETAEPITASGFNIRSGCRPDAAGVDSTAGGSSRSGCYPKGKLTFEWS